MYKMIGFSVLFLLSILRSNAQITTPTRITKLKVINQTTTPVYSLTNARVSINTGRDNKEFPSFVQVWLYHKGKGVLYASPEIRNEMQVK